MSRIRLPILSAVGMMTVLIVAMVGAAAASAAFELLEISCNVEKLEFINFCWATSELGELMELSGAEKAEALLFESTEIVFTFKSGATNGEIKCKVSHSNIEVENHPLTEDYLVLPLIIEFKECALQGTLGAKCKVPVELNTKNITGVPETDEEPPLLSEEAITFSPEGAEFIEIPISTVTGQSCILNGVKLKVTGKQQCLWVEPLVDLLGHLLKCAKIESLLRAAGNAAEFEAHYLVKMPTLETQDWWDIEED